MALGSTRRGSEDRRDDGSIDAAQPRTDSEREHDTPTEAGIRLVQQILVVDDDPDINRLVRVRLTSRGFAVETATNGEEALARIAEARPDLIFLDVSMPGIGGLEVLDVVRTRALDLGVIMMTAFGSESVAIEALRRGADDYLRKPFDRTEFGAVLERTVRRLELSRQNAWLRAELETKHRQLAAERTRERGPGGTPAAREAGDRAVRARGALRAGPRGRWGFLRLAGPTGWEPLVHPRRRDGQRDARRPLDGDCPHGDAGGCAR